MQKTKKTNKKKRWTKYRHKIVRNIAAFLLRPYMKLKYGIKVKKFNNKGRQYLILMNHQTPFDQFFISVAFRGAVYYVATEDIFSNGFVSSLIRYLVAPIPIKKNTADPKAIMNCIKVCREGGTIAIAPEGNRTYSGRTGYMAPTIAPLARKLGMPIALFRIEGGYGVEPRWSEKCRRGSMRAYVSEVIEPEEYNTLTDDELFERIKRGLYVDEAGVSGEFTSRALAEYIERALYVCPDCGLTTFYSEGDVFSCKRCGRKLRYTKDKRITELDGTPYRFPYFADLYDYQESFVNELMLCEMSDEPLYTDEITLREVIPYKKKRVIAKKTAISLYPTRVTINGGGAELNMPYGDIFTVACCGKNKLNIYFDGKIYQIKGDKRFCALKYMNFYYRYKNIQKGDNNGKFLGL